MLQVEDGVVKSAKVLFGETEHGIALRAEQSTQALPTGANSLAAPLVVVDVEAPVLGRLKTNRALAALLDHLRVVLLKGQVVLGDAVAKHETRVFSAALAPVGLERVPVGISPSLHPGLVFWTAVVRGGVRLTRRVTSAWVRFGPGSVVGAPLLNFLWRHVCSFLAHAQEYSGLVPAGVRS